MKAITIRDTEVIKTDKLDHDADAKLTQEDLNTALIVGAVCGHAETVRTSLGKGANAKAKDQEGRTALILAALMGHTEIIQLLKQAGARE